MGSCMPAWVGMAALGLAMVPLNIGTYTKGQHFDLHLTKELLVVAPAVVCTCGQTWPLESEVLWTLCRRDIARHI